MAIDPKKDGFIKFFTDFYNKNIRVNGYFKEIIFPELNINDLGSIDKKINIDTDIDSNKINNYVLKRYRYLLDYLK